MISLKESLISNIKGTKSINSIKKDVDNTILKDCFSTFTNDKERDAATENGYSQNKENQLKDCIVRPGTITIKDNSEFGGKEIIVNLDTIYKETGIYDIFYVDYINLWKNFGMRKLSFIGNLEGRYVLDNRIGIYGISNGNFSGNLDLPNGIELNIEHKDYGSSTIGWENFSGMNNNIKYNLKNFYFYLHVSDKKETQKALVDLSADTYYKNGNYNALGFPFSVSKLINNSDLSRIRKFTGADFSERGDRFIKIIQNAYGYKIMYNMLKNYPYFPITNLYQFSRIQRNMWAKDTCLVFYVPGTEADGRKEADKYLKDNSNPYVNFEFITYDGNIHKTKKEEAELKSGGFAVLSIS